MDWIGACDVGETNLAFSFISKADRIVRKMYRIDMSIFGTDKIELGPSNYGRIVLYWIRTFKEDFNRCSRFGIELQPQFVGRSKMHIIQAHLESAIRCEYPNIDVILLDPKRIRKWLGTSGGDYKTRKNKSVCSGAFSHRDIERMKVAFPKNQYSTKTKKWSVKHKIDDVVEASLMALYLCEFPNAEHIPIKISYENVKEPSVYQMTNASIQAPSIEFASQSSSLKRTKSEDDELVGTGLGGKKARANTKRKRTN
jgi:hypothetical protein